MVWGRLWQGVRHVVAGVVDLWYPAACLVCDRRLDATVGPYFCEVCLNRVLGARRPCCRRCGMILPDLYIRPQRGCGWCAHRSVPLDGCVSAVLYRSPIRELILRCKNVRGSWLCRPLGRLLAETRGDAMRSWGVDVVFGVPRHFWRRFVTGYDQGNGIAAAVAFYLGMPEKFRCCPVSRLRRTAVHSGLSPVERARNVRKAFGVTRPDLVRGRRLLVIDDVMTSGATLFELARTLKKAGASAVFAATVARAAGT